MGPFDPNIEKGSRINGQNTLLKKPKKKQKINGTRAVPT